MQIGVVDLVQGHAEIQLSQHAGDGAFGCAINLRVKDVDGLFRKYVERGLDTTGREDSPVHRGPVNQTWGIREFYVTDADGNTLPLASPCPRHTQPASSNVTRRSRKFAPFVPSRRAKGKHKLVLNGDFATIEDAVGIS